MRRLLLLSVLLNLLLLTFAGWQIQKRGGLGMVQQKVMHWISPQWGPRWYASRVEDYRSQPVQAGDVVFAGDSLVDGADWSALLGRPVRNRGIGGEDLQQLSNRMVDLLAGPPHALLLQVGANDVDAMLDRGPGDFIDRYAKLVDDIHAFAPQTRVLVNSLLPLGAEHHGAFVSNRLMQELNAQLQQMCIERSCEFIDAWSAMAGNDDALFPEMTIDSAHLSAEGLQAWAAVIRPTLDTLPGALPEAPVPESPAAPSLPQ